MEIVACNLCGHAAFQLLYVVSDWSLERTDVSASLVKCTNCGLVYQNPRPDEHEILSHYPDDYECYNTTGQMLGSSGWLLQKAAMHGMEKRIAYVPKFYGGRLLDIGCATGNFLWALKEKRGLKVQGVEISEYAAKIARQRGIDVFTGTLKEALFDDNSFDVVTLWDVFEHLHDPAVELEEIRRILAPDGYIIMRLPNMDSWDAKLFGPYWAGLEPPRHLYVFSPKTLRQMLEMHGFKIQSIDTRFSRYLTFVLSLRFWMIGHGYKKEIRERIINILQGPAARVLALPFFRLYGSGLKGPLMTVVAKKTRN